LVRASWRADDLDGSLARVSTSLDALARELDLRDAELAQMWSAAVELLEDGDPPAELGERVAELIGTRVEAAIDADQEFAAMLELLRARGCWDRLLELLLRADSRHGELELDQLDAIASAAARDHDDQTRLRARVELGVRRAEVREFAGAAEAFADALAVAPDRPDLQYRLGDALAGAGRIDAALEQLLPLLQRDDLPGLL